MSNSNRIGLGNTVSKGTPVFHGGIADRESFGRITDQVNVWLKSQNGISQKNAGEHRVLLQAMLEFAFPEQNSNNGHLEVAVQDGVVLSGIRFQNFIVDIEDSPEKTLTQYWLNSPDAVLIKRILYPQDLVEIRFSQALNLIELRIVRALDPSLARNDLVSFRVVVDSSETLSADHDSYLEMGDFNQSDWITRIYQKNSEKSKSGEIYLNGNSIQSEEEMADIVVNRELIAIDEMAKSFTPNESEILNQEVVVLKANESGVHSLLKKNKLLNELLRKKELAIRKQMNSGQDRDQDLNVIQSASGQGKRELESSGAESITVKAFRDKALQMYEMAKRLQTEKESLLIQVRELQSSQKITPSVGMELDSLENTGGMNSQFEELLKKTERLSRALDAEKAKVKTLSDRVTVAEKEAQSAGPMMEDLEIRIEVALKNAQQYKKEIESVKQKLVQAEAEKNKVKNELVKAEAQIQTLMKRHAS